MTEQDGILLPCPFCASQNIRVVKLPIISKDFQDFTMHDARVECLQCGADGPARAFVKDIRQAWNDRK